MKRLTYISLFSSAGVGCYGFKMNNFECIATNELLEARLDVHDIFADARSGKLTEAFGTGTAAVISPVGVLAMDDEKITLGDGGIGPVAQKLYDTLTGIQMGRLEAPEGWIYEIG